MTVTFGLFKPINGDSPDVDELMSNHSFILTNMLNFGIDGATTTNQQNYNYIEFTSGTTIVDEPNSTSYFSPNITSFVFANSLDNFEDDVVDTGIWTKTGAGLLTESGGNLVLEMDGDVQATSSGASGFDARTFSGNCEIILDYVESRSGGGATISISNGSTHVTIRVGGGSSAGFLRVVINKSGETMDVYEDDSLIANNTDISSVTTNWYLRFEIEGATGGDTLKIAQVSFAEADTSGSQTLISNSDQGISEATVEAGITRAVMTTGTVGGSEVAFSANAGGAYVAGNDKVLKKASTSGTQPRFRYTLPYETSINAYAKNIPTISGFAYYFG